MTFFSFVSNHMFPLECLTSIMALGKPLVNMDTWEDDDKTPKPSNSFGKAQWEGEDEEDDVQESWDQEPEEEQNEDSVKTVSSKQFGKSEAKEKKRRNPETVAAVENHQKELSPEEVIAEKLRQQKLQEESDLDLAKEIFGVCSLETKEDFDQFREEITRKIADCSTNPEFANFAEQIIQVLCLHLSSSDLKKIHNLVTNLHIEKLKMEKGDKTKKHKYKIKAKLKMDDETDYNEYSAYTEDFGDFM